MYDRWNPETEKCGTKWCVTVMFPPLNSIGLGSWYPQSDTGRPITVVRLSQLQPHLMENSEKLKKKREDKEKNEDLGLKTYFTITRNLKRKTTY